MEFKEGEDYCFIYPKDDKHSVYIKLLKGVYKDTIFKYGKVKVKEDPPSLLFAFDVIESTVAKPRRMEKDLEFRDYLGDLLVHIMTSNMDEEFIDEAGTDDAEVPDLQRGVL